MSIGTSHMIQNIACKLDGNVNMFIIKPHEHSIKYLYINWVSLLIVLPLTNLSIINNEIKKTINNYICMDITPRLIVNYGNFIII
jgi:hypothetical protein